MCRFQVTTLVLASMEGEKKKAKERKLFSLWPAISMNSNLYGEPRDLSILYEQCEFTTCDTVNYKPQFIICKLFSDVQQQKCH